VLRSTGDATPPELAEAVDAVLLRDLAAIAGIPNPVVSPVDLSEIQLNVGCTDEGRACLEAMARAAGVSALLVRSLDVQGDPGAWLELRYFDSASSDEPKAVRGRVPAASSGDLVHAVPVLVRELFGIPEVAEPAEPVAPPETVQPAREPEDSSIVPWILIGAGAAALTTGVIVGAVASEDFSAWKDRRVQTAADAERADADFEDLETRAIAADIAMAGGAIAAGLGVALLLFEGSDERPARGQRASIGVAPRPDGLSLHVQGSFHEAW